MPSPKPSRSRENLPASSTNSSINSTLLKPETDLDHILIGKMAAAHWRQNRIGARERKGEKFDDVEMSLARQFPAASIATCASAL